MFADKPHAGLLKIVGIQARVVRNDNATEEGSILEPNRCFNHTRLVPQKGFRDFWIWEPLRRHREMIGLISEN